ncbi:EF hand [compost metagenome]
MSHKGVVMSSVFNIKSFVQDTFKYYDHNKDGKINVKADQPFSVDERRAIDGHGPGPIYTLRPDFFKGADANKDGSLTPEELDTAVRAFDKNGNGEIDGFNQFNLVSFIKGLFTGEHKTKDDEYSAFSKAQKS